MAGDEALQHFGEGCCRGILQLLGLGARRGVGVGVEWLATGLCNVLGGVLLAKRCSSG